MTLTGGRCFESAENAIDVHPPTRHRGLCVGLLTRVKHVRMVRGSGPVDAHAICHEVYVPDDERARRKIVGWLGGHLLFRGVARATVGGFAMLVPESSLPCFLECNQENRARTRQGLATGRRRRL
jgi:hypothetical protein